MRFGGCVLFALLTDQLGEVGNDGADHVLRHLRRTPARLNARGDDLWFQGCLAWCFYLLMGFLTCSGLSSKPVLQNVQACVQGCSLFLNDLHLYKCVTRDTCLFRLVPWVTHVAVRYDTGHRFRVGPGLWVTM